jgi:flagellar FliL protein
MSETPEKSAAAPPAPKKSRTKLFIIVGVVVLLLGGGGGAAYWVYGRAPAVEGEEEKAAHEEPAHHRIISFEPFVVNLADTDARRFLRINVRLVVADEEGGEHAKDSEVTLVRLRSEILDELTKQTADAITTPDGKAALKTAISARAAEILKPMEVADVLFSDFVVQY